MRWEVRTFATAGASGSSVLGASVEDGCAGYWAAAGTGGSKVGDSPRTYGDADAGEGARTESLCTGPLRRFCSCVVERTLAKCSAGRGHSDKPRTTSISTQQLSLPPFLLAYLVFLLQKRSIRHSIPLAKTVDNGVVQVPQKWAILTLSYGQSLVLSGGSTPPCIR